MTNNQEYLNNLTKQFEILLSKQEHFAKELMILHKEIERLKKEGIPKQTANIQDAIKQPKTDQDSSTTQPIQEIAKETPKVHNPEPIEPVMPKANNTVLPKQKSNIEKFIGENLLNKIGIIILVFGVAIGAKYSIENDLISPLTRIIIGYLTGLTVLGFGIKLKEKYTSYSAVLVSGAITILYFITFAAYSFYSIFPQLPAFGIMVVLTVFAVIAAVHYNKQAIAHIGLVGAYAVPFLLSNGSGQIGILFCYMSIINIGILVLSFKKDWKGLFYSAFCFTWLIYASWFLTSFKSEHFSLAFLFLFVFFLIFYTTFIVNKIMKNKAFSASSILILLANSFLFFGFGFFLLDNNVDYQGYLGVFTAANALLHFCAGTILYKQKLANNKLLYFILGMVFVFITIAVPVQLDGNYVTLLWVGISALLFWIGTTKDAPILKKLSYPLLALALISLTQDWGAYLLQENYYGTKELENHLTPILNINLLSSVLCILALYFIYRINIKHNANKKSALFYSIPSLLILLTYVSLFVEIIHYWNLILVKSTIVIDKTNLYANPVNYDLSHFKIIWLIVYTLFFLSLISFLNIKKIKNNVLGIGVISFSILILFISLTLGLFILSDLRDSYLHPSEYYNAGIYYLGLRYVLYLFVGLLIYAIYSHSKQGFMRINFKIPFSIVLNITTLWILSSELIHWIDLSGAEQTYGLELSILWGLYSFFLVAKGIWKKIKYIRIGGIILFGITIVKLFFLDLASLNTISKTLVLVILGLLILGVSFLYNKYKNKIFDETKTE
ncbi:DUF2339 domain-containing protein [Cellulophaga sp. F20128]|uniref:DUF2339 domain-containing protein n=1 Tax=Cellulophaga sp. F20128 TaxID=2926413 RepID=UPI001FF243ED|nr:DUF2339 domain-containing protein [Cellulophaga sp. F20128]MCK0158348.1 DUF2339 domain-containing protein [Cellulophaga sp. F20128]